MATGPEHYREAEKLLGEAADPYDFDLTQAERNTKALGAQVHATLALAAATALGREGEGQTMPSKDRAAWFEAAAECRKATAE